MSSKRGTRSSKELEKQYYIKELKEHFVNSYVNWQQVSNVTGYKKSRGSSASTNYSRYFRIMVLNIILWRFWCHYLEYKIPLKDSENLEKWLCARDKAANQYWMPLMFKLSGNSEQKQSSFCHISLHGLSNTSRNHCLRMQFTVPSTDLRDGLKIYHAKKKPTVKDTVGWHMSGCEIYKSVSFQQSLEC